MRPRALPLLVIELRPVVFVSRGTIVKESFDERRCVGDQAAPGLIARVIIQYDDVTLYPPTYFNPTVGESKLNPDAKQFLLGAHLFAGTWVEGNRARHNQLWSASNAYCRT